MIHDFADLSPRPQVIEKEFKMKPEEFDKQFLAWLDAQTKTTVDGFDEWKNRDQALNSESAKAKKWDDVIKEGTHIRDLYSDYVEAGSVYEFLSRGLPGQGRQGQGDGGAGALFGQSAAADPDTLETTGDLPDRGREEEGSRGDAGTAELDLSAGRRRPHQKLGDLYMELGIRPARCASSARCSRSKPVDLAGAHYELARALHAAHAPTTRATKCSRPWKPRPGSSRLKNFCWN